MDPFNLFWKTAAGLEKVMYYPVKTEWDPNTQSGNMIVGGVTFTMVRSEVGDGVEVWVGDKFFKDIDKSLEKFMIADAMEFILGGLA